ncbi:MAG: putative toxin-antitoxin system toxin component, PIN family [Anaerolineae bacterium]|nr:putative toxin-antitoxin system toxin component, PIN family [Anaerolineae bacterium]
MIRAVLDTNVFLRALINPHSRCGRLLDEFADDYALVLSPAIVREVLEVLHQPRLRAKFPQIAQLDMARIIGLFEQAQVVEPQNVTLLSRDPQDDKILACARSAGAEYLVTEDKDLLVLEEYEGTKICQPAEFIALLEARRAQKEKVGGQDYG